MQGLQAPAEAFKGATILMWKGELPVRLAQLRQLLKPTEDGDVISNDDKHRLIDMGMARRCVNARNIHFTAITPMGIATLMDVGVINVPEEAMELREALKGYLWSMGLTESYKEKRRVF